MKLKAMVLIILSVSLISGCATPKQWVAVGGSRSDGTVKLAFEYGLFEKPELEQGQGTRLATQKCGAWGYSGAESFGSTTSQCVAWNNSGCLRWRVFAEFQCTSVAAVNQIPPTIEPIESSSDKQNQSINLRNGKAWLGVTLQGLTDELAQSYNYIYRNGVLVVEVTDNSPAIAAGLQSGDIIKDFDGKPIINLNDIPKIVSESPLNKRVTIKLYRNGNELVKEAILTAYDNQKD